MHGQQQRPEAEVDTRPGIRQGRKALDGALERLAGASFVAVQQRGYAPAAPHRSLNLHISGSGREGQAIVTLHLLHVPPQPGQLGKEHPGGGTNLGEVKTFRRGEG